MKNINEIKQSRSQEVVRGVGVLCDFFIANAKNAEIWSTEGKRYIDFAGGIGVLNTGHLHPKVQQAVSEQLQAFSHSCYQVVPYEIYTTVAKKLNHLVPIEGKTKTMFVSTGAEAVENAIKMARSYTKRSGVIAFQEAFHGRTNLTLGLTGKVAPYKLNFGPFSAQLYHAPFPNALHGISVEDAIGGLHKLFKCDINPQEVAAIIIEPVQGEGGFNIAPATFLKALRAECDQYGIVLIFDEIQSGFARTGRLFATEHSGVSPDIITMAKSLAGGYPLSAVVGKEAIMDAPDIGGLGGTYAGHPVSLAAANAVIEVIEEEKLCERAEELGKHLITYLQTIKEKLANIVDVRGLGSMVAVELQDPKTGEPDAQMTKRIQTYALEHGLILLICGSNYNVLRFLYPLTIEDHIFEEGLAILQQAIFAAVESK